MSSSAKPEAAARILEARAARLGYRNRTILDGVDLDLDRGDYLGVVGPNGAGKTTMLLGMLGVLKPQGGTLWRSPEVRVAYVPQRTALDDIFPLTVRDVVEMGRELAGAHRRPDGDLERVLSKVGLEHIEDRRFSQLSGGQKQRVLIARALIVDPDLLILDEPTNGLDFASESAIMALVDRLHEAGSTIVLVTHLLNLVANHARSLALVGGGRVTYGRTHDILTGDRLAQLYGRGLRVASVDDQMVVLPAPEAPR